MSPKIIVKRKDLVYPELSYQIMGIVFDVWTSIGEGHKESFYQKAVAEGLKASRLAFEAQLPVKVLYKGKMVGIYYFDFLVESKVILELKAREYFSKNDINQVYSYLKARNFKLGLLVHFTKTGVKYRRVVNVM